MTAAPSRSPEAGETGPPLHEQPVCTTDLVEFWLDIRLVSPNASLAQHWASRWHRASAQRELVAKTLHQILGRRWSLEAKPETPKHVHFTAYVGQPFDDDNLVGACKAIRDGLQDAWLISGDAPRDGHRFTYEQRAGFPSAQQGVRISVRLRSAEVRHEQETESRETEARHPDEGEGAPGRAP